METRVGPNATARQNFGARELMLGDPGKTILLEELMARSDEQCRGTFAWPELGQACGGLSGPTVKRRMKELASKHELVSYVSAPDGRRSTFELLGEARRLRGIRSDRSQLIDQADHAGRFLSRVGGEGGVSDRISLLSTANHQTTLSDQTRASAREPEMVGGVSHQGERETKPEDLRVAGFLSFWFGKVWAPLMHQDAVVWQFWTKGWAEQVSAFLIDRPTVTLQEMRWAVHGALRDGFAAHPDFPQRRSVGAILRRFEDFMVWGRTYCKAQERAQRPRPELAQVVPVVVAAPMPQDFLRAVGL